MAHSIIAPTYFWPVSGSEGWTRVIMAAAYVHAVLLNPNSGVGQQREQVFNDVVNASQAAGMKVLGYVRSEYGDRAVEDIAQELDTYSSWYGVDGFFVDEMYHWGKLYLQFVRYARTLQQALRPLAPLCRRDEGVLLSADSRSGKRWLLVRRQVGQ